MIIKFYLIYFGLILSCFNYPVKITHHKIDNLIFENSVFAIVKISYNHIGETPVEGGICGTAFLLNDSTVITANHVLNRGNFIPNSGYKFVQYWLLKRNAKKIIQLKKENLTSLPNIELTLISLDKKIEPGYKITYQKPQIGDLVYNFGHISNMPVTSAHWENELVIDDYTLENSKSDKVGKILSIKKCTVHSADLEIVDKLFIQPSFVANVGMSGGLLISENRLIGLMSFGLPSDSIIKKEVYAISINEILEALKR